MLDLGDCIYDTANKSNHDGGDTGNGDGCIEKNETRQRNREFVQGSHHRIGRRRRNTDTPRGSIGDEDRRQTGEDHGHENIGAVGRGEIPVDVFAGPVFDNEGKNDEERDRKEVVVEHG